MQHDANETTKLLELTRLMSSISRTFEIYRTIGRYRLDELTSGLALPWYLKLFLQSFRLFKKPSESRGERLKRALEDLGPIYVKLGQLLSTRPDLIPADIALALNQLQDNVRPFPSDQFVSLVEKELKLSIDELFTDFDRDPLASASVAQVHTARLKSGEEVVIKAVRPGISALIKRDLSLLHRIANQFERYHPDGKRLKPKEVVRDYEMTILDELDLLKEACNASQLKRNFEGSPLLYIPEVHWPYTTSQVMVMERIYGIPVSHTEEMLACGIDLKILAERGVEIFFTQVFEDNFFHADMHPGNIFVSRENPDNPSYIGVDMAIMGSLSKEDRYYLARNLLAMFERDYHLVAELHVTSGWVPAQTSVAAFESAIRTVSEPYFNKPLKEISFAEAIGSVLKVAQRFQMPVQPQLVLLQKTLLNVEGLGRQLYPELNLWDTAKPYLKRWIRKRYSPRTIGKEILYQAPEWIEKFPEIPQLIHGALVNANRNANSRILDDTTDRSQQAARSPYLILALLLAVLSLVYIVFSLPQTPLTILALIANGVSLGFLYKSR